MIGSWPDGLVSPKSSEAAAVPNVAPGSHISSTPETSCTHGIDTGPPVSTTTVWRLARATASMSAF